MSKILITGCRRGIGLNAAGMLLERGHKVYVTVHRAESVEDTKKKLQDFGDKAVVTKLDIRDENDLKKTDEWNIDVLINNAALGDSGPLSEIPFERVEDTFKTNVFGALKLTQRVLLKMIENKQGRIIFISSMAGVIPTPFLAPYAMTKFALENAAASLRSELKPFGIKIVLINPGGYATGFNTEMQAKKYDWMKKDGQYAGNMKYIKDFERRHHKFELKNTDSIAKKIVKAVEAKRPRRRYFAPRYQWHLLPLARRFL